MRQKMFGNSGGFGFSVSFVDRASMFLNLSLRRRLVSPMYCKEQRLHCIM